MTSSVIVSSLLMRLRVTPAVELDSNPGFSTEEVKKVAADRVLPAKLDSRKTTSSKMLPEQLLAIGLTVAQLASL